MNPSSKQYILLGQYNYNNNNQQTNTLYISEERELRIYY